MGMRRRIFFVSKRLNLARCSWRMRLRSPILHSSRLPNPNQRRTLGSRSVLLSPRSARANARMLPYRLASRAIPTETKHYAAEVQPCLTGLQPKDIVRVIDVSRVYARQVIAGQVPHARHFAALAKLAGVPATKALRLAPVLAQATAASEPQSTAGPYPDERRAE